MNIRNLGHDKWELLFFMALSVTTFLTISSLSTSFAAPYYSRNADLTVNNQGEQISSCCSYFYNSETNTQFQITNIFNK